ncbi:hypothetical protein B0H14DRAFT_2622579 [Mycena olivaceomarginata]|nr:hypothetical protein B0H14DRAFT_2622579 [Mycena olivaceomarginata]
MRGWLPLRELMGGVSVAAELAPVFIFENGDEFEKDKYKGGARRMVGLHEVHPNVEQLMRIADLLKDARRVVGLEDDTDMTFVVKGVEAAKPAAGVVPPAPVAADAHHQDALASIRARALRNDLDLDDDAMMEQTSVTDDDILHDVFSFLNRTGSESKAAEASDEDEIIDAPVSPIVPTAHESQDARPPPAHRDPGARRRPAHPWLGSIAALALPRSVPSTTALDLLNTFAKKPVAVLTPPAGGARAVGMGVGMPDEMLLGSRAALQSIWSASRDERGLMFAGGGGASGGGVGQQQQQQQLAHQHAHAPQYQGLPQSAELSGYTELGHGHSHGAPLRIARPRIVAGLDRLGVVLPFRGSAPGATRWLWAPSAHAPSAHAPACRVEFDGGRAVVPERRRQVRVRPAVGGPNAAHGGGMPPGSRACSTRHRARGSRPSHKNTNTWTGPDAGAWTRAACATPIARSARSCLP